jgi:hypothetical protein
MVPILSTPISLIFTVAGGLLILLGLFNRQFTRFIGLRPQSELFTTPRFKRSARITERLGSLFLVIMGIFFLNEGIGPQILSIQISYYISLVVLAFCVITLLAVLVVNLAHWNNRT